MRIALLASTFLPRVGGAEIVVHSLARQLRAHGHLAHVVTWWGQWRAIRDRVDYPVIPLLPRSFTPADQQRWEQGHGRTAFVGAQIRLLQAAFRFDVWNIHMAHPMGILAGPALRAMGMPVVATCHGDDVLTLPERNYGARLNPHLDNAIRSLLHGAHQLTAISPSIRDAYLDMGVPKGKISSIPNGVSVGSIRACDVDRTAVRRRYGIPEDVAIILLVGRNHPLKNHVAVAELARVVRENGVKAHWVVVGEGVPDLKRFMESASVSKLVTLLPGIGETGPDQDYSFPPQELIEIYRSTDVFCSLSITESFGMATVEAMAAGLPVVATDITGSRDIVRNGVNGFLCPLGNHAAMAQRIMELLAQPELRQKMGRNAIRSAESYDWVHVARQYEGVYRIAVARPSPMSIEPEA